MITFTVFDDIHCHYGLTCQNCYHNLFYSRKFNTYEFYGRNNQSMNTYSNTIWHEMNNELLCAY